ncbi:hypothetical protein F5Y13DRAFT_156237 [Hypoxylon sp. FL1857]|nr:hypothetical protein F5Y13DRAFT_156237 [Hypoxylon sp. FL1857]
MSPSEIQLLLRDDAFDAHTATQPETRNATGGTMESWMIVAIVLAVLIFTSLIVLLALYLSRRRRRIKGPTQNQLSWRGHKRGKMSESDRLAAEEIERTRMIRKSLASRSSSVGERNSQDSGIPIYHQLDQIDREERVEREPVAPSNDTNWKDLEAGTQNQGSTPGVQNTEMGIHPALLSEPQLAFPAPSRSPSPYRGPQPPRLIIPS